MSGLIEWRKLDLNNIPQDITKYGKYEFMWTEKGIEYEPFLITEESNRINIYETILSQINKTDKDLFYRYYIPPEPPSHEENCHPDQS